MLGSGDGGHADTGMQVAYPWAAERVGEAGLVEPAGHSLGCGSAVRRLTLDSPSLPAVLSARTALPIRPNQTLKSGCLAALLGAHLPPPLLGRGPHSWSPRGWPLAPFCNRPRSWVRSPRSWECMVSRCRPAAVRSTQWQPSALTDPHTLGPRRATHGSACTQGRGPGGGSWPHAHSGSASSARSCWGR